MKSFLFAIALAILCTISNGSSVTSSVFAFSCGYAESEPRTCFLRNYKFHGKHRDSFLENITPRERSIQKIVSIDSTIETFDEFLCESFNDLKIREINVKNSSINFVEPFALKDCKQLEILDMSQNKITDLERGIFKYNRVLLYVNLSYNALEYLDSNIFMTNNQLEYVDLSHNKIKYIQKSVFFPLKHLKIINLKHNQLLGFEEITFLHEMNPNVKVLLNTSYLQCTNNNLVYSKDGCLKEPEWLEIVHKVIEHDAHDVPSGLLRKYVTKKVDNLGHEFENKLLEARIHLQKMINEETKSMKQWFESAVDKEIDERSKELSYSVEESLKTLTNEFGQEIVDINKRVKDLVTYETLDKEYNFDDDDVFKPESKSNDDSFATQVEDAAEKAWGSVKNWSEGAWSTVKGWF